MRFSLKVPACSSLQENKNILWLKMHVLTNMASDHLVDSTRNHLPEIIADIMMAVTWLRSGHSGIYIKVKEQNSQQVETDVGHSDIYSFLEGKFQMPQLYSNLYVHDCNKIDLIVGLYLYPCKNHF